MLTKSMILAVVQTSFQEASEAFRNNPSATNFQNLHISMYALQQAQGRKEQELKEILKSIFAENWVNTLAYDSIQALKDHVNSGTLSYKDLLPYLIKQTKE